MTTISPKSTGAGGAIGRSTILAAFYLVCFAAAVWPVFAVDVPALVDYPNHLARMRILADIDTVPALRDNYAVHWMVVPNLAMDAVVPFLSRLLGLDLAGKVFIALSMCLPVVGVMTLRRVLHGHVGFWPAVSFLFVYNHLLFWGFLNYLFGVGLSLLALAGWIATSHWRPQRRLLAFTVAAVALYLAHFFAFSIYGLSVLAIEVRRSWLARRDSPKEAGWRFLAGRFCWSMAQFVPPAVLLLNSPNWDGVKVTEYGILWNKVIAVLSPMLSYYTASDYLCFALVLITAIWLFASGRLRVATDLKLPLTLLTVAAVLMPAALLSNWAADERLPVVLVFMIIAGVRWARPNRSVIVTLSVVAVAMFVGRTIEVTRIWQAQDQKFAEFRRAARVIEPGARVLTVQSERYTGPAAADLHRVHRSYWHMTALAVIDRGIFTPMLFTNSAAQPVRAAPDVADIDVPFGRPITPAMFAAASDPERWKELVALRRRGDVRLYWKSWQTKFDYVLDVNWGERANPSPRHLRPVARGSFFDIYKVVPDSVQN